MTHEHARYHSGMVIAATTPVRRSRTSRFKRLHVPDDAIAPPFRVTERVISILSALASHRFMSTDQIARNDGGSVAVVRNLMRVLHRHGYVDRPAGQAAYLSSFMHDGNVSLVYCITRKGMRLLAEHGKPVDPRLDWTTKNTGESALFLAHALQVSDVMLDFRLALIGKEWPRLIDHNQLYPSFPEATRASKFPYRLLVTISQDNKPFTLRVIPDRLFNILHADGYRQNFALELDRGTESLMPRSKRLDARSTFAKKLSGYYHAWQQDAHTTTWGFGSFRVLTVTTSDVRIENMLRLQREVTDDHASGVFLYSTRERIAKHGVLGPAWRSTKDDSVSLERSEQSARSI